MPATLIHDAPISADRALWRDTYRHLADRYDGRIIFILSDPGDVAEALQAADAVIFTSLAAPDALPDGVTCLSWDEALLALVDPAPAPAAEQIANFWIVWTPGTLSMPVPYHSEASAAAEARRLAALSPHGSVFVMAPRLEHRGGGLPPVRYVADAPAPAARIFG